MERLTDKEFAKKLKECYYGYWDVHDKVYLRLAELEDKIESGGVIELPCIKKTIMSLGIVDVPVFLLIYQDKYGEVTVKCYYEDKLEYAEDRLKELKGEKE